MNALKPVLCPILSSYLKKARRASLFTQEQMADQLGISVRSYANLEHGRSLCSTPVLILFMMSTNQDTIVQMFRDIRIATGRAVE